MFSTVWRNALSDVLTYGEDISPRGKKTKEILHRTVRVNMMQPVLTVKQRKLSYQFMAAEAYWILSGSNKVEDIAPFNKHIANFSDDGETFYGAYGPKVVEQLPYVVDKLKSDPDTRQAGLTIWRENPPETKDVPCTITIFFNIRKNKVNCHVFMRSSDIWLGLPYDVFNFSMITYLVCARLNEGFAKYAPGELNLTAASSHLYEPNFEAAENCVNKFTPSQPYPPKDLYMQEGTLMSWLEALRHSKPGSTLRWWE